MLIISASEGAAYPLALNEIALGRKDMHRSFHQLGILVASIVMAIGLTLIAGAAIFRLDIMETIGSRETRARIGRSISSPRDFQHCVLLRGSRHRMGKPALTLFQGKRPQEGMPEAVRRNFIRKWLKS